MDLISEPAFDARALFLRALDQERLAARRLLADQDQFLIAAESYQAFA
jgi:hypothetical protein